MLQASESIPLCLLFNRSLKECLLNGDPSLLLVSNYRPVSLLTCVGKIMKHIMFVYNFFFIQIICYTSIKPVFRLDIPLYINSLRQTFTGEGILVYRTCALFFCIYHLNNKYVQTNLQCCFPAFGKCRSIVCFV